MNKHHPECWKGERGVPGIEGPCTCGIDDPPPVTLRYAPLERYAGQTVSETMKLPGEPESQPCPHCHGTGRLTTPEPPVYRTVEPYVGGEPPRTHFDPTNDVTDLYGIPADPTGSD